MRVSKKVKPTPSDARMDEVRSSQLNDSNAKLKVDHEQITITCALITHRV